MAGPATGTEPMTPMTRRQFLQRTGKAALAVSVLSQAGLLSACGGDRDTIWDELAQRLRGPLARPGDASYSPLYLPYNRRYEDVRPQGDCFLYRRLRRARIDPVGARARCAGRCALGRTQLCRVLDHRRAPDRSRSDAARCRRRRYGRCNRAGRCSQYRRLRQAQAARGGHLRGAVPNRCYRRVCFLVVVSASVLASSD